MATAVLRPQDFWSDRLRLSPSAFRRRSYYPTTRPPRRPSLPRAERHDQRRKSPSPPPSSQPQLQRRELISAPIPRRSLSADELQQTHHHHNKFGAHTQTGGRVRILRREQSFDTIDATRMKRDVNNVARDGLIKEDHTDEGVVYAGSAFFVSPSPSDLPLPSFFNNNKTITSKNDQFRDSATRDLRRLLRLD